MDIAATLKEKIGHVAAILDDYSLYGMKKRKSNDEAFQMRTCKKKLFKKTHLSFKSFRRPFKPSRCIVHKKDYYWEKDEDGIMCSNKERALPIENKEQNLMRNFHDELCN